MKVRMPDLLNGEKVVLKNKNFILVWDGISNPVLYVIVSSTDDTGSFTSWVPYRSYPIVNKTEKQLLSEYGIKYWCTSTLIKLCSLDMKPVLIIERNLKEYISQMSYDHKTLRPKEGKLFKKRS